MQSTGPEVSLTPMTQVPPFVPRRKILPLIDGKGGGMASYGFDFPGRPEPIVVGPSAGVIFPMFPRSPKIQAA
jgi:hypothetical protein